MLKEEVDEEDIAEVVSKWTGVPVSRLMEGEMAKLSAWRTARHERVVGQDEAVVAVANASAAAAPACPTQPAHRLVPVPRPHRRRQDRAGPALAEFLFDDERAMVRIDMSEYMEKHAVSPASSARPPATSATTRAASSPRPCAGVPTR
jgi:ATP-dependent Clp protease ATP-binding subunit ClpB